MAFFCEAYFPQTFHLAWSPDHLKVIAKIEQAVLHGGLFAMAMPRGSGKTTICECACIWAALFGHRDFVCLIGSDEGHAMDMLDSIKTELDGNDLLLEGFPEVVYPIRCLDGIANRASGQLFGGQRTHIGWTAREIVLPTMPGSQGSGAIIKVAGLTGRIREMKYKRADGRTVRPSLVVLDDPQTDESARSLSQCATRESILAGAVLGLAGPGKKISGIMPCTVIRPGDMADNILDRDKHPEWNGERTKMVYSFPKNEKLWSRYAEIRAECLRRDDGIAEATEFYRAHRDEMDQGAVVAWPERHNYDELSAVQHAMNLKLQSEAAFFAEYQNEPLPEETAGVDELTADQIAEKTSGMRRGEIPIGVSHLTMFVDVQASLLFYVVAGWGNSTDVVYQFCRQSPHAGVLMPSHGRFVGASSQPFSEYKRKRGDRVGHNWRIPNVQGRRAVRHVVFDTNYWKSFVHARLATPMGDRGCLSLFGDKPQQHRLFAEHITAEYRIKTEGRGRVVDEWKHRPERPDNHWFDCLVGSAVAASIQGAVLPGTAEKPRPPRRRIRLSDLQRRRR